MKYRGRSFSSILWRRHLCCTWACASVRLCVCLFLRNSSSCKGVIVRSGANKCVKWRSDHFYFILPFYHFFYFKYPKLSICHVTFVNFLLFSFSMGSFSVTYLSLLPLPLHCSSLLYFLTFSLLIWFPILYQRLPQTTLPRHFPTTWHFLPVIRV